jgi:LuxR family transcriptional regulator of csgAB operon
VLDEATTSDHLDAAELSPRELEVLRMTSFGLTNAEIAERLQVTVHAVKFHLARIYRRLGVANRTEAAVMYLRAQSPEVHANRDAPQTD